jgi:DNA-binding NtrC family response regulator
MATIILGPIGGLDIDHITGYLRGEGFDVLSLEDTKSLLAQLEYSAADVVVADIGSGRKRLDRVLSSLDEHNPSTLLIGVTDRLSDSLARSDVVSRLFDLMEKPVRAPELLVRVRKAVEMRRLINEAASLRGDRKIIYDADGLVAESDAMKKVLTMAERVAQTDSTVLLSGETGTGKEMIAAVLHYNSPRAERAFVRVNCAALPETLLETELFGHERGAFTGARGERIGRFEQADGGTLLLDEVADLSGGTQAKLLRVLQERQFERVGGSKTLSVDVRLISSTNRDLPAEVAAGHFREDLFYRLNVFNIHLPPLRERRDDILPLARTLFDRHARELHQSPVHLSAEAEAALLNHEWPGNIRELENVVERAIIMTDSPTITPEHLDLRRVKTPWDSPGARGWRESLSEGLHDVEKETILRALEATNWVQKDAAKLLHISPRALNYRIRKLGIRHSRWRRNR